MIKAAADLVRKLYHQKNLFIGLLTGNHKNAAQLKIKTVGLADYFKFGVYGNEADDRNGLARLLSTKAKRFFGLDFLPKNVYIIGDTPHDVVCGKYIKAKTVVVSTGSFTFEELKKAKPDLTVKSLAEKKVYQFIIKS